MKARSGMQVANVKHSHCEAKFRRVRRKTSPVETR
jgi:hypothetical protein